MKPILVPYDENMTKEELLKAIADAVGSDVETVKKELCESKDEPQTEYDKYREKIRAHDPHKDWFEDEPQTDCSWK